ncbi:MAG TPA: hypothetical protein VER17_18030 [Tepidisphaeraceae bacterium]|nr:hypothetical protein [Tepidisphaeraceae bacterium]
MARAATGTVPPPHTTSSAASGATSSRATSGATAPPPPHTTTAPIRPRERRKGNRSPLGVIGVLTEAHAADKQLEVDILNVSPQGCAFRAPVAYRPGATYTMRIGTGPLHLASIIRIISSRTRADGSFDVGAKFV